MNAQRLRAFAVTVALVLGAGTMSAVAAPLLREEMAPAAVEAITSQSEDVGQPTEAVAPEPAQERTGDAADEDEARQQAVERRAEKLAERDARAAQRQAAKAKRAAVKAERKPAKAAAGRSETAKSQGEGRGNGHGQAVSSAARGETEPVGNCRNHGHWVSSVAKGKASCDDNPRSSDDADD